MNNYLSGLPLRPSGYGRHEHLTQFKVTHDYFTGWALIILHEGEMRYSIEGGGEHTLRADEMLICPPFFNPDKAAVTPVSFSFFMWVSDKHETGKPLGELVYRINERIREDVALIEQSAKGSPFAHHLQMDIWYQLCTLYSDPVIPTKPLQKPDAFTSLLTYIDQSLNSKITLDDLAAYAGYSKSALIRYFRENTKQTPMQYVNGRRVDKAKKQLSNTRLTIREIALETGFPNEFYFSTVFHRQTGMTPSEFRMKNSGPWS